MSKQLVLVAAVLTLLGGCGEPVGTTGQDAPAGIVYLVRHAEALYPPPADDPRNPPLAEVGRARAKKLAHVLHDAGITRIYSTELHRTQQTAAPLARRLGIAVETYDPGDLAGFARRLLDQPGRVLVSGHSNTTPELVALLGGEPGEPIDEKTEFDRLYVVILAPGRPPETLLLHYGPPPQPWPPPELANEAGG